MAYIGSFKMKEEPIIVATYEGDVNIQAVRQGSVDLAKMLDTMHERAYLVVDVMFIQSSIVDVLQIMAQQSAGEPGTSTDSRIAQVVLVGTNDMAKMYSNAMQKQHKGMFIPMYAQFTDALSAVRTLISMADERLAS